MSKKEDKNVRNQRLAENRRARHEYLIEETIEAGLVLVGSEVKAIRDGRASLTEAYCQFHNDELWLIQAHIGEYTLAHARNHEALRKRKVLLHRKELRRLQEKTKLDGIALVPLDLHITNRCIKLNLAVGRGKKMHDKRATLKERDAKMEIARAKRGERE